MNELMKMTESSTHLPPFFGAKLANKDNPLVNAELQIRKSYKINLPKQNDTNGKMKIKYKKYR